MPRDRGTHFADGEARGAGQRPVLRPGPAPMVEALRADYRPGSWAISSPSSSASSLSVFSSSRWAAVARSDKCRRAGAMSRSSNPRPPSRHRPAPTPHPPAGWKMPRVTRHRPDQCASPGRSGRVVGKKSGTAAAKPGATFVSRAADASRRGVGGLHRQTTLKPTPQPARWPACTPSPISSIIFALNCSRSAGLRLVTSPLSVTTASSTQVAPALRRSVCSDG